VEGGSPNNRIAAQDFSPNATALLEDTPAWEAAAESGFWETMSVLPAKLFGKFDGSGVSGSTGRGRSQAVESKVRFADQPEIRASIAFGGADATLIIGSVPRRSGSGRRMQCVS
jgi:hypothetical protein